MLDSKKKGEYTVCKKKKSLLDNSLSKFSRSHAQASVFFLHNRTLKGRLSIIQQHNITIMSIEIKEETRIAREALIEGGHDEDAIDAYIKLGIGDDDLSDFEEAYQGQYKSDKEFAQEQADAMTSWNSKEMQAWPHYCIDWEYAARELMMDYSEQDGYYFRNL